MVVLSVSVMGKEIKNTDKWISQGHILAWGKMKQNYVFIVGN